MMPGVYDNVGWDIRARVADLQSALNDAGVELTVVVGADVHVAPDVANRIRSGAVLTLNDSRYVLIEPPHHVAPPRLEEFFFGLMAADYHPILTHPERLTWIDQRFDIIKRLYRGGAWMQLTSGSLLGSFGRKPQYWSMRLMDEGMCHILATDAHGSTRRPPNLRAGFDFAAARVGEDEAVEMVLNRPYGILENRPPHELSLPKDSIREESPGRSQGIWSWLSSLIDDARGRRPI